MAGIWDELGIAPTGEASAIRRAYAVRLKVVRPDSDPQGFARLRQAYERALANAGTVSVRDKPAAPEPAMPAPLVPPPAAVEPAETGGGRPLGPAPAPRPAPDPLAEHLRRRDVLAAADWLAGARVAGVLNLSQDLTLSDRLGWTMAQDRSLPADAVRAAAARLGWPGNGAAEWAGALRARLDAERWLDALRRDAASRKRWLGAAVPIVARIMLGRGRLGFARIMARDPRLKRRYGEYWLHAPVVGDQFDAARTEAIRRLLTMQPHPVVNVLVGLWCAFVLAWLAGMAAAQIDPRLQDGASGAVVLVLGAFLSNRRRRHWLQRTLGRLNRR